jgi:hypothetical protein
MSAVGGGTFPGDGPYSRALSAIILQTLQLQLKAFVEGSLKVGSAPPLRRQPRQQRGPRKAASPQLLRGGLDCSFGQSH